MKSLINLIICTYIVIWERWKEWDQVAKGGRNVMNLFGHACYLFLSCVWEQQGNQNVECDKKKRWRWEKPTLYLLWRLETESSEFDQGPNHLNSRDSLVVFRVALPPIVLSVKETHPMRSCRPNNKSQFFKKNSLWFNTLVSTSEQYLY